MIAMVDGLDVGFVLRNFGNAVKYAGEGKVKEIGDEIHLGAMVFMSAEYSRLAIFCIICILALWFSLGWETAISFLVGALSSGFAGFVVMVI